MKRIDDERYFVLLGDIIEMGNHRVSRFHSLYRSIRYYLLRKSCDAIEFLQDWSGLLSEIFMMVSITASIIFFLLLNSGGLR